MTRAREKAPGTPDFAHRWNAAMNKSDLIVTLAKEADLPLQKSEEIVNLVFDTMSNALIAGDRIEIRGFGSFMVKEYKGYTGRNPKTGEKITVTEKRLPFFKTGKELREHVDEED
jgi:integration host factor subunit beta